MPLHEGSGSPRATRGVSLIEVLVALVITSVGVLSVISLQLVSTRSNVDAAQRLLATHLAHSLAERMRANASREALIAYVDGAAPALGRKSLGTVPPEPSCVKTAAEFEPCDPVQRAAFDLWLWERLMDGATEQHLPSPDPDVGGLFLPTACVAPPATGAGTAGVYTVTVAFRGTLSLPSDPAVTCGQAATMSGYRIYGDNDEYRRTIGVQAFITPAAPK